MAIVRVPSEDVVLRQPDAIRAFLVRHGIDYEQWVPSEPIPADASGDAVLAAYAREVDARFNREHWHDEDEVRFIIEGRGLFHVHPANGPVFAIEVEAGDLIRVPRGTHHWFDLCADRRIRAIRLFQDPSGWTPHYTESGVDQGFQPVCFGPVYVSSEPTPHA
jgi:1,2-dihydroxy-3-keto-5-methylthiopentene dioxygenase